MTATVHAHNELPNGAAAVGSVVITVNTDKQVIRDPAGNIVFQGPATVALVAGSATFTLPASDDDTLEPSGFTFTATEQLKHVSKDNYRVVEFQTTDGSTHHLADFADTDEVAEDPSYGANLNSLTARVLALEEGGGGGGATRADIYIPDSFDGTGFATGLAAMEAGTRDLRYCEVGDSTSWGYSPSASNLSGSPLVQLVGLLNDTDLAPAGEGMVRPISTNPGSYTDARWTFGTGWTKPTNAADGAGASDGASGLLSFAPGYTATSVTIYYAQNASQGTVTVKNGATTLGTIVATGSNLIGKATFALSSGSPTITLSGPTGGGFYCYGMEFTNSAARAIRITNMGVPGSKIVDWDDSDFPGQGAQADAIDPDIYVVNLTVNDSTQGTTLATWRTKMETRIGLLQATGASIALCVGVPSKPGDFAGIVATQQDYANELKDIAYDFGCAWVDLRTTIGGVFTKGLALGYYDSGDGLHPKPTGYAKGAESRRDLLLALAAAV